MPFNFEAARRAGVSDSEISEFLAPKLGFNLTGARAAGVSEDEIVSSLVSRSNALRVTEEPQKAIPPSREVERMARAEGPPSLPQELKKLAADIAPIALSTAGSILAPQIALPARALALLPKAVKFGASLLGGTAGGALGGAVEAGIEGGPVVEQALKRGGEAAVGELVGGGVIGAAAKALSPLGRLARGAPQAVEFAEKMDLPISPAEIFPSTIVRKVKRMSKFNPVVVNRGMEIRKALKVTGGELSDIVERAVGISGEEVSRAIVGTTEILKSPGLVQTLESASPLMRQSIEDGNIPKVVQGLFESKGEELLKQAQTNMVPEEFQNLLTANLSGVLGRSTVAGRGGAQFLDGTKLEKEILSMSKHVRTLYSKETLKALEGLSAYARLSTEALKQRPKIFTRRALAENMPSVLRMSVFTAGVMTSGLPGHLAQEALFMLSASPLARALGNPKSPLTQFLVSPKSGSIIRQLPRIPAKAIVQAEFEPQEE